METWFSSTAHESFTLFSTSHLMMIILYFISLAALLYHYQTISKNRSLSNAFRWSLAGFLILSEITYQMWMAMNGTWRLADSLPLHICSLAGILAIISFITPMKTIVTITFFLGFIPAGLTIITPEISFDYPHYRYWQFFLHHILLSCASFYLVLASKIKITFKSTMATFGALLLYAFVVGVIINPILGGNYLFLSDSPENETLINFLGSGITYIVNLVTLCFLIFMISFGIYKLAARSSTIT